ncbi:uncharacterized protein LOC114341448 isoform X1 [Diabrotica virgifera virgifera]|uniref:Uncharacterized protein n=1 Tax=Diabrotica virgifera virgifera TaxID=50390 RepID=A0ABM5KE51_DIAVI|nr:uncharacterized protein LOC114341448 isoform X1 [Diabrotica virgifera virgifera]
MKYPQVVSMPSAVSNWLDEQLEARGIDAVVYTRYILSLLHSHTVDVLYPEDDFQFPYSHSKKDVRRYNRGYLGSHRSSSDWWRHVHADAEQIKRSAAIKCLLSASEQNCEIESLVDELCEKLKEVNSETTFPHFNSSEVIAETVYESKKITPQELAEKYYAAFPPLCPQSPSESKLLSLIPKWRNVTASSSPLVTSPIKKKSTRKNLKIGNGNRSHAKESHDTMKARNQTKQRLNCLARNKNNLRNNATFNGWDLSFYPANNKKFANIKRKEDQSDMEESFDQCVEINSNIWDNEDEVNMYEDLPVDIIDLLDSPRPSDDTVEMMNIANMRDTGKRRFIPYGTSIMSSIWSTDQDVTFDNNFNSTIDASQNVANNTEFTLDFKFSAISIDNPSVNSSFDDWPPANSMVENETNALFETNKDFRHKYFSNDFHSLPGNWSVGEGRKVDEEKEIYETEKLLAFSLMKLNHNKEKSGFQEVTPRSASQPKAFNPFGKSVNTFNFKADRDFIENSDKEDLLTSERSHFKPICEKDEVRHQSKYADGATFIISNNLDKVDYKRSESGTMWLETEFGQTKKYYEYKTHGKHVFTDSVELILKFSINENDKACQTDDWESDNEVENYTKVENKMSVNEMPQSSTNNDDHLENPQHHCACPDLTTANATTTALNKDNSSACPTNLIQRPESMLSEVVWKYEEKSCEKCHGNNMAWSNNDWSSSNKGQVDSDWAENGLRSIWSGGEICQNCLVLNGSNLPRPAPNHQLREDISQDGEQLLSDLSTIQKCYMDDLPVVAERSLDILELLSSGVVPKERKRRHSLTVDHNPDTWSFASRIEEDCLMQLAALPALRAVTL